MMKMNTVAMEVDGEEGERNGEEGVRWRGGS